MVGPPSPNNESCRRRIYRQLEESVVTCGMAMSRHNIIFNYSLQGTVERKRRRECLHICGWDQGVGPYKDWTPLFVDDIIDSTEKNTQWRRAVVAESFVCAVNEDVQSPN